MALIVVNPVLFVARPVSRCNYLEVYLSKMRGIKNPVGSHM